MIPRTAPNSSPLGAQAPLTLAHAQPTTQASPVWAQELPLQEAPNGYVLSLDQSLFWVLFSKLMVIPTILTVAAIGFFSSKNIHSQVAASGATHAHEKASIIQSTLESVSALSALLVLPCILGMIGSLFWMATPDPRSPSRWKPANRLVLRLSLLAQIPLILFQFVAAIATFVAPPKGSTGPTAVEDLVTKSTSVGTDSSLMITLVPLAIAAMLLLSALGFIVSLVATMSYAGLLARRLGDDDLRGACGRNTILVPGLYLLVLPAAFIAQAALSNSPGLALGLLGASLLGPVIAFTLECLVFWRIKQGIDQILVRRSTPSAMTPIPLRHAA